MVAREEDVGSDDRVRRGEIEIELDGGGGRGEKSRDRRALEVRVKG